MKKILSMVLLAICCLALSQQQASAWTNQRFGFNFDWQRQSGGNSVCGMWKNGQPPAPSYDYHAPMPHHSHARSDSMGYSLPALALPMPNLTPFQFANGPQPFEYYTPVYGQ